MIEKMNIFDVEIPILTAKEAMIRAMQYLESESVDTIELVSMDMLMKERENAQWKEQINELTMLLPENTEHNSLRSWQRPLQEKYGISSGSVSFQLPIYYRRNKT